MVLTDDRRSQFQRLGNAIRTWAAACDDVVAIALVGSWVHDAARMDSDIDVVVVTPEPDRFVTSQAWLSDAVGEPATLIRTADWGALTERRVRTASGVEVEFGVVRPSWAATDPVDPGTHRVVSDGCLVWYDPGGLIATLIGVVSGETEER